MTDNESSPQKISGVSGVVVTDEYAKGSKSHHQAIFIQTVNGRFLLRRKTGPSLGDKELLKYVGREISCDGFLVGDLLLAERITPVV